MDWVALRYFFETADCGSVRQASDRLHLTPSAVSRQIAKLEHELGAPLFERRSTGMKLTEAGRILREELQSTMRGLNHVRSVIGDLQGLRRGEITIHCIEGVAEGWLPAMIEAFTAKYPLITFNVVVGSTSATLQALGARNTDAGITFEAPRHAGIEMLEVYREPLVALVAPGHPLAGRAALRLADLSGHPVVLPDASFGVRRVVDRLMRSGEYAPRQLITTNQIAATRGLARQGVAYALLPLLSAQRDCQRGELIPIPLADADQAQASMELCVHKTRALSAAAREFVALLRQGFQSLAGGSSRFLPSPSTHSQELRQ